MTDDGILLESFSDGDHPFPDYTNHEKNKSRMKAPQEREPCKKNYLILIL